MLSSKSKIENQIRKAQSLILKNDLGAAKLIYLKILNLNLKNKFILEKLADICIRLSQYEEACEYFSILERLDASNVLHLTNLAFTLDKLGQFNLALQALNRAKQVNSNEVCIYLNETVTLCNLKLYEKARDSALAALKIEPYSAISFNNLGAVFQKLGDNASAEVAFSAASEIDPTYLDPIINLAGLYVAHQDYEKARLEFERILTNFPNLDSSTVNLIKVKLAYEYLRIGDLSNGWQCFELAFDKDIPFENSRNPKRTFLRPKWNGESLINKTILVWGEQGLGDEIAFATCLNDLLNTGAKVIVECDPRLVECFSRSFPLAKVRSTSYNNDHTLLATYDDFDYHIPLGSLMYHFRKKIDDFKLSQPYLLVSKSKALIYEDRLNKIEKNKFRIGISWRSGILQAERNNNYTSILDWESIFKLHNIELINLQYGECELELLQAENKFNKKVIRWADLDLKNDIDATLALISRLDYVISIGNAVALMAAAVGVPTLLACQSDQWDQFGTNYYPLFPTVKLFPTGKNEAQAKSLYDISAFISNITD